MSLKEPNRDSGKDDSQRESAREKRRRQRAAAKRQKALAASERKRRKESAGKPAAKPSDAKAPEAKPPEPSKSRSAARKPGARKPEAKKPEAKKPEAKKLAWRKPEAKKPAAKPPAKKLAGRKPERGRPEGAKPDAEKPKRPRRRFGARPRRPGQVAGKAATTAKTPTPGPTPGTTPGKPGKSAGPPRRPGGDSSKVGSGLRKVAGSGVALVVEVLKLGREMLVIPLQVWLAIAEVVGGAVLAVWLRAVLPALRLILRALAALVRFGERHVTPARAITVVALVAVGALVAAQWRDYSAISVGTDAYAGDVGAVAPPPEISSAPTHDAHGWVMLILAALTVLALIGAFTRRRRLSVWLIPIGVAVLAISIGIDAPKGLDEGEAALAYESANASLLSGFWLEIAAGAVLVACGLMLPRALRPASATSNAPAELGPSLIDRLVAGTRGAVERRRARPKRAKRLPRKLRRPATKGKVQGAGT
jgi:hypothetical protein